jgi:shikimate dehydrogenase
MINKNTKIFCSFSKEAGNFGTRIHNAAFQHCEVDAIYKSFSIKYLSNAIVAMKELGISGAGISAPYKIEVLDYCDNKSADVEEIGAANTIINSNGKIIAYNTDWLAARNLLSRFDNKTIYILGNGGYSKAVQYAAKSLKKETKVIARANWTDLYFLTGQVIFNATPLKDLKLNESNTFIDCHVGTGTGTELALIQAAHQFKLYTGIDFPSEYIKTLL